MTPSNAMTGNGQLHVVEAVVRCQEGCALPLAMPAIWRKCD